MTDRDGMLARLGDAVRLMREERELSVDALAVTASVDPARIAEIEAGELDPDYESLLRIADAMRTSLSAIFLRAEELVSRGYDEALLKPNGAEPEQARGRPVTIRWRTRHSTTPDARNLEARLTLTFGGRPMRFLTSWLFPKHDPEDH